MEITNTKFAVQDQVTVQDLLNELNLKAKHYQDLGAELESTIRTIKPKTVKPIAPVSSAMVSVQSIKAFMKDKAYRAIGLSKQFNVPMAELEKLLTPENGFTKGSIGWYWITANQVKVVKDTQPVAAV